MNRLILAFRAFWKTLYFPELAELFLQQTSLPKEQSDFSHLRLLNMLQQSGRLVDFFKEDINGFTDEQIGAVVRKIHTDCSKTIEDVVTIRPLMEENEGAMVHIPAGYDPSAIKVVGKVKGEPPFTGILIHKGWKAHKRSLPKRLGEQSIEVICPAEVEVK